MTQSTTGDNSKSTSPNQRPRIGWREIGSFLLLPAAAGLQPRGGATPPAQPATLVAS